MDPDEPFPVAPPSQTKTTGIPCSPCCLIVAEYLNLYLSLSGTVRVVWICSILLHVCYIQFISCIHVYFFKIFTAAASVKRLKMRKENTQEMLICAGKIDLCGWRQTVKTEKSQRERDWQWKTKTSAGRRLWKQSTGNIYSFFLTLQLLCK